jgi:Arc/MetJ-type ribon-helix-helix transcriptional regulator
MDPISFQPIPVETQLQRLRVFNTRNALGITESEFEHLTQTAPPWPTEPGRIRSLRVHTEAREDRQDAEEIGRRRYLQNNEMCQDAGVMRFLTGGNPIRDILDSTPTNCTKRVLEWLIIQLVPDPSEPEYLAKAYERCQDELMTATWIAHESFREIGEARTGTCWETGQAFGQDCAWGPMWDSVTLFCKHGFKGIQISKPLPLPRIVYESESDLVRVSLRILLQDPTIKDFYALQSTYKASAGADRELLANLDTARFAQLYEAYRKTQGHTIYMDRCAVWIADQVRSLCSTT